MLDNTIYLTLCTFSLEINESSVSDIRCLIQDAVSPHCGDKRMARRCTRRYHPSLRIYLPAGSISKTRIKVRLS